MATKRPVRLRDRYSPAIVKRVPANDHRLHWAGHGHVRGFLIQLSALIAVTLGLWAFFFWAALRYADRAPPPPLGGPL